MTFSDPAVAKALRRDFVCTWVNIAPAAKKYPDGLYDGVKMPQGLRNGTGVTNVAAVFVSPDGTVIHAMPGYLDPATFQRHLEFAKALDPQLSDPWVSREERARIYIQAHLDAEKRPCDKLEQAAHRLLAARFMRVEELPPGFFGSLGGEG